MTNLGDFIKSRRTHLDMTLEEVGKMVGVSKGTVAKWESGDIENMKRDKIAALAKALNVSPLDIMGIGSEEETNKGARIPLLGRIAAGAPIFAEENIEDYFNIDTKINADFALHIKGDSMIDAHIFDGDVVFIRKQDQLENGEIGAVLIEEEATLKRFYQEEKAVVLQSENRKYRPIVLTNGHVKILGKMVAVLHMYA